MTVFFSFLLHIYQPPVQLPFVVKKIADECYRPLVKALTDHDAGKITLNINATLTEQLYDYRLEDVIDGFKELSEKKQVDFTGSGKFHPLLPLIPQPEIERQIRLNHETNRHFFGPTYSPKGFFPPELAVDPVILDPIRKTGHEWFIMSAIGNPDSVFPTTTTFQTSNGLRVIFRDDLISNDISFDRADVNSFFDRIKYRIHNEGTDEDYYVVVAQDGETYGHHVKHGFEKFFIPMLSALKHREDVQMVTVTELTRIFPRGVVIEPKPSSWSTLSYDMDRKVGFPLWYEPGNRLHELQHKMLMRTMSLIYVAEKYAAGGTNDLLKNARNFLDRGSHSCMQWWASKRPWYSPDMIIRGLNELILAAVNAKRSLPPEESDIQGVFESAIHEILEAHNTIIESL
ncbi:MAG: hypothetical protein ACFFD4_26465 [Candidatus Odinarchaeota archaeon]